MFPILAVVLILAGLSSCQSNSNEATGVSNGNSVATSAPAALKKSQPGDAIQWISWNEAVAAQETDPKLLLVDVYTDWCKWCKVMDEQTFSDPQVADYINEHFYAVKLNAENEEPIMFRGQEFKVVAGGRRGIHTLAYALLDGQLSYPSYVYLNENYERMHISKGFKPVDPFMTEIKAVRGDQVQ
ncbi:MAG: DUF255 domain-containing protein [Lewinella sp.]|nr:DUF255 domain-containing protein [Lewinella sp.]